MRALLLPSIPLALWPLACDRHTPETQTTPRPTVAADAEPKPDSAGVVGPDPRPAACQNAVESIGSIQGSGAVSPRAGQSLAIEGVVVGDFQEPDQWGGFFVQSLEPDSDPDTSEGLFVFDGHSEPPLDVSSGQWVRVEGKVSEFGGMTQMQARGVVVCGRRPLPPPTPLEFPLNRKDELEALEGMRVVVRGLTVTETKTLGRYGEVGLSSGGRLFGSPSSASSQDDALRRLLLDDGRKAKDPRPVPHLKDRRTLRLGDTAPELHGVLHEAFGHYRLQPSVSLESIAFRTNNPRPSEPPVVAGMARVASLNLLNYFTTLNRRGARSLAMLDQQRRKLVTALLALDADVYGLSELENGPAGGASALEDLVRALNRTAGTRSFAAVTGPAPLGRDAIRVGMLYRVDRVRPVGPAHSDVRAVHSRPPLAQTFERDDQTFSVVVVHFKSRGGCPSEKSVPNADRGEGCWGARRTEQARALLEFVDDVRAASGDEDVLVVGDFNALPDETPLSTLRDDGFVNLLSRRPAEDRYSYVFDGYAQLLDHAFASTGLSRSEARIWHINADEPAVLAATASPPLLDETSSPVGPHRSSDHDPLLVGLRW